MPSPDSHDALPFDRPDPLMTDLLRGESGALADLYDRDSGWIFGLALWFVDGAAAEQVVHAVFRRLEREPASGAFPGLSHKGRVIRLLRAESLALRASGQASAPADLPGPSHAGTRLARALDGLTPDEKALLRRVFWRGAAGENIDRAALQTCLRRLAGPISQGLRTPTDSPDGLTAAEFFLGSLPEAEARIFAERLEFDDTLAEVTGLWIETLSQLVPPVQPVAPSAELRQRLVGAARRDRLRGVLARLDLIPTVLGGVVAMLLAFALLWVSQGGLRRTPPTLQASLSIAAQPAPLMIVYRPGERRMAIYPDAPLPEGSTVALKIGADAPVPLGTLEPAPRITVLTLPDSLPRNLEGAVLILSANDQELARGALSPAP